MAAAAVRSAKQSLRAELKQRLRALSAEERRRQSRLLTEKVIAHSQYQKSKRISIFLSMPDEIDTEEIIKDMFQRGKTCFIPRYQFQSNHMDMVRLASPEEISSLPKTSWNIHQPGEDEVREEAFSTEHCSADRLPQLEINLSKDYGLQAAVPSLFHTDLVFCSHSFEIIRTGDGVD
ncbi:5-formyltetrahydrofolate cyclo-ligase isoform X3 [Tamandua tetradactyla]|uniref:5-formyltetrahydrofolate cyclo-ligase isoform X3 n=1 Tax=Tamandua tetradactyla TaxID=48850 RepID=UPI0040543BB3